MTQARVTAFLGTSGAVRAPARFDMAGLLAVMGGNAGNLLFQYAATRLIEGPHRHIGRADTPYDDPDALRDVGVLVFPAANHLRLGADWGGLCAYLEGANRPLVILGLGAQAALGQEEATLRAMAQDPMLQRLAAILRERSLLTTLRGPYSAQVAQALGLRDFQIMGCPSWLLNPDPALGARIGAGMEDFARAPAPFALAAASPFELPQSGPMLAVERHLLAQLAQMGGLYVQQSGGVAACLAAQAAGAGLEPQAKAALARILSPKDEDGLWPLMARTGYLPISAPDWIARLQACALGIGTRLHGALAALAAGRAGLLITHDSRTSEAAAQMHLPVIAAEAVLDAGGCRAAVARVSFDPAQFDAARQEAARLTADGLRAAGLNPSAHLLALARAPLDQRAA